MKILNLVIPIFWAFFYCKNIFTGKKNRENFVFSYHYSNGLLGFFTVFPTLEHCKLHKAACY